MYEMKGIIVGDIKLHKQVVILACYWVYIRQERSWVSGVRRELIGIEILTTCLFALLGRLKMATVGNRGERVAPCGVSA